MRKIGAGTFGAAILCQVRATAQFVRRSRRQVRLPRFSDTPAHRAPATPPPAARVQVVMKKIDIHDMSTDERRTAQREASLLASLRHPAVLHHIESFEEGGFLCIVTEFCERGDLAARLERQRGVPLAEGVILDWFAQILLALLYVHKKHVLHRDLVCVVHARPPSTCDAATARVSFTYRTPSRPHSQKLANIFLSADNGVVSRAARAQPCFTCLRCRAALGGALRMRPVPRGARLRAARRRLWHCTCAEAHDGVRQDRRR